MTIELPSHLLAWASDRLAQPLSLAFDRPTFIAVLAALKLAARSPEVPMELKVYIGCVIADMLSLLPDDIAAIYRSESVSNVPVLQVHREETE